MLSCRPPCMAGAYADKQLPASSVQIQCQIYVLMRGGMQGPGGARRVPCTDSSSFCLLQVMVSPKLMLSLPSSCMLRLRVSTLMPAVAILSDCSAQGSSLSGTVQASAADKLCKPSCSPSSLS